MGGGGCAPFFRAEGLLLDEVEVVVDICGFVSGTCRFCLKADIRVRFLCSGNPEPADLIWGKLGALGSVASFSLMSVIKNVGSMVGSLARFSALKVENITIQGSSQNHMYCY